MEQIFQHPSFIGTNQTSSKVDCSILIRNKSLLQVKKALMLAYQKTNCTVSTWQKSVEQNKCSIVSKKNKAHLLWQKLTAQNFEKNQWKNVSFKWRKLRYWKEGAIWIILLKTGCISGVCILPIIIFPWGKRRIFIQINTVKMVCNLMRRQENYDNDMKLSHGSIQLDIVVSREKRDTFEGWKMNGKRRMSLNPKYWA